MQAALRLATSIFVAAAVLAMPGAAQPASHDGQHILPLYLDCTTHPAQGGSHFLLEVDTPSADFDLFFNDEAATFVNTDEGSFGGIVPAGATEVAVCLWGTGFGQQVSIVPGPATYTYTDGLGPSS